MFQTSRYFVFVVLSAVMLNCVACSDDAPHDDTDAQTQLDSGAADTSDVSPDTQSRDADSRDADATGAADADADASPTDAEANADASGGADHCGPAGERADETFDHIFEVGPGQAYADPSEVPWESIEPGPLVRIHYRAEPYATKWVIATAGTADKPVVVRGVMDGDKRPVITGEDAVTRTELDFWNEDRGVVKIGGSSQPSQEPSHVRVENLEITGAHPSNAFVDESGSAGTYRDNAAAFYIESGTNVTLENCVLRGSGNGLFVTAAARDVLISGNYIHGNGIVGSYYEHNSYTEAIGITFEYNRYGPLCDGCGGNNLKDRSAGTVIRYNWIESGNRQLDLVESSKPELTGDSSYRQTFVYGNVLVEPSTGGGNRQIVHYGGDGGDPSNYRKGALYFYHNTVVTLRSDRNTLLRLSTNDELAVLRNNLVYAPEISTLSILAESGQVDVAYNWLPEGWINSFDGGFDGAINSSNNLTGSAPGFVDLGGQDYTLASDSVARGAAGPLETAALPLECQYDVHQGGAQRSSTEDLGAF